jgi:hypothetical protein
MEHFFLIILSHTCSSLINSGFMIRELKQIHRNIAALEQKVEEDKSRGYIVLTNGSSKSKTKNKHAKI